MKSSKLTELLASLSKDEFRKLGDFLKSPFFNKSRYLILFYRELKKYYYKNNFEINRERLYKNIFKGAKYNDQAFRSLSSDFVKIVEKFMWHLNSENNLLMQKTCSLIEYRVRGLSKNFKSISNEIEIMRKENVNKNEEYYYLGIVLEIEKMEFGNENIIQPYKNYFLNINNNIDLFLVKSKLSILKTMLLRAWFSDEKVDYTEYMFIEEVTGYIEKEKENIKANHLTIYMDHLFLKMYFEPQNERHYFLLKEYILKNLDLFTAEEANEKYLSLENYCTKKKFENNEVFQRESLNLFKSFEKKGIFDKLLPVSSVTFYNSFYSALSNKDITYSEYLLAKYSHKLSAEHKKELTELCMALLSYSKKKYTDAMLHLKKIRYLNYFYYLRSKVTMIKIGYETDDIETVIFEIDNIKHYLKRNKKLIQAHLHYDGILNFIKIVNKMLKKYDLKKEELLKIKKEFETTNPLDSMQWLKKEIEILTNKNENKYFPKICV